MLVVYGRRIVELARGLLTGEGDHRGYVWLLVLATIPAGLVGVLLNDVIEAAFDSLAAVGAAFLLTGIILWSTRRLAGTREAPTTRLTAAWNSPENASGCSSETKNCAMSSGKS